MAGQGSVLKKSAAHPYRSSAGRDFPVGIVGGELAAQLISSVGNGSTTSEINQIGNRGSLPGSIEMNSTPAVEVIGRVPEPSSALIFIAAVLAMAVLRSPSRCRAR